VVISFFTFQELSDLNMRELEMNMQLCTCSFGILVAEILRQRQVYAADLEDGLQPYEVHITSQPKMIKM
jgi:hypothetical protein